MNKIAIPTLSGFEVKFLSEITHLKSEGVYTDFFFIDKSKITSSKNIGYYEDKLVDNKFLRVHNSYIVNLSQISKYIKGDNAYLLMTNNELVYVSKSKKDNILQILKNVIL